MHSARPGPSPRADPVLNDMYLSLQNSVSATTGNHIGLAKPGQLSQVKQIQSKTKYTRNRSPNFIPRQKSCCIVIYAFKTFVI